MKKVDTSSTWKDRLKHRAGLSPAWPESFACKVVVAYSDKTLLADLFVQDFKKRSVQIRVNLWLSELTLISRPRLGQV